MTTLIIKETDITVEFIKNGLHRDKSFNTIRINKEKHNGRWIITDIECLHFAPEEKNRFLSAETLRFFKNLGGKETVKAGYLRGFGCTINTSTSPDNSIKRITHFFE